MVFGPPCKRRGARLNPFPLVCKFVVLGAEARQADAIAVTSLGYDVELIELGFLILSHSRNFFGGY